MYYRFTVILSIVFLGGCASSNFGNKESLTLVSDTNAKNTSANTDKYSENSAQEKLESKFDLLKSLRRLTNNKLVEIENLIDQGKYTAAMYLTVKNAGDLNNGDRNEIIGKLRPRAKDLLNSAISELMAIQIGSDLAGLRSSGDEIKIKYSALVDLNELIIFFNLKDNLNVLIDSKMKEWFDSSGGLIQAGNGNLSTNLTALASDFTKVGNLSKKSSLGFCENLVTTANGDELFAYSFCKKFLPEESSKIIRKKGLTTVLERVSKVDGALERMENLSAVSNNWNILDGEWINIVKPLMPKIEKLESNAIPLWLDKSEFKIGLRVLKKSPEQNVSREKMSSRYKSGETTITNPQYVQAELNYQEAVMNQQNCLANYRVERLRNPYAMNFCGINRIDEFRRNLSSIYPTQTIENFLPYDIDVSAVEVTKKYINSYYIYSSKLGRQVLKQIDKSYSKVFKFAEKINANDRNVDRGQYSEELDIKKYIDSDPQVESSRGLVFEILNANEAGDPKKIVSTSRVSDINTKINTPETTTSPMIINKLLSDSLVVINGKKSLGAGFFVMNRFVLTNQHVVDGASLVEIETKDGQKSTGVVIISDVGIDLALIATTFEGTPIELMADAPTIGEDVFALGHPRGLKFSASRGIISSIRNIKTISGFGLMANYIQTDVAINPGNSGGPLILNGKAVGVNTFKRAEPGTVGLGFALSSVDVRKWLNEKMPR
jgi:S1-C subfamily serine protease